MSFIITTSPLIECETISYNLGGLRTDAKQKGLQVVRKSDGTMKKVIRK